eukprot:100181-Prymnesium_polylepis.1
MIHPPLTAPLSPVPSLALTGAPPLPSIVHPLLTVRSHRRFFHSTAWPPFHPGAPRPSSQSAALPTNCASRPGQAWARSSVLTQRSSDAHQPQSSLSVHSPHDEKVPHATPAAEHECGIHIELAHSSALQGAAGGAATGW